MRIENLVLTEAEKKKGCSEAEKTLERYSYGSYSCCVLENGRVFMHKTGSTPERRESMCYGCPYRTGD